MPLQVQDWHFPKERIPARARALIAQGTPQSLDAAAALAPRCSGVFILRGRLRADAGDRAGANADFGRAAVLHPEGYVHFAYPIGRESLSKDGGEIGWHALGRRRQLFQALRREPRWWIAGVIASQWGEGANTPSQQRRFESLYKTAFAGAPRKGWLLAHRARFLINAHRSAEALQCLAQAARLEPDSGWIQAWYGHALGLAGRQAEGLRALRRATELAPDYFLAQLWLGNLLMKSGELAAARVHIDRSFQLQTNNNSYHVRSRLRQAAGDWEGAVSDLSQAVLLDDDKDYTMADSGKDAPVVVARGLAQLLESRPGEAMARLWLGDALLRGGDRAGAREELQRFLAASTRLDRGVAEKLQPLIRLARRLQRKAR